jgi:hypothetical protein
MLTISVPIRGAFYLRLPDGREVEIRLYRLPSRQDDSIIRVVIDAPQDVFVHRGQRPAEPTIKPATRPPATLLPLPPPKAKRPIGEGALAGRVGKTGNQ